MIHLFCTGDPSEVCSKLAFKAKAQGSKDNISVITVFLQDPKQLAARRKAHIMETAMEQRNSLSSSYGQDTSGFGPETDVDTPDEPIIGLSKPKGMFNLKLSIGCEKHYIFRQIQNPLHLDIIMYIDNSKD